ncbi:penicillin-binding protein 2 [Gracilimonas sp.]|uniref:penicillin-binding protein 2 n=1 Tax=Gracilimonas sp. TaxID=1974203 RepID=UPI00287295B7|nr:penicillin-binding protein 2 [Gracilimonas sp.]
MSVNQPNRTRTSIRALQFIMLSLTLIVLGRVFYLQIVEYEVYAALGQENSVRQEYVDAARGLIYDRNNTLIVDNEPIYSITITPSLFDDSKIPLLSETLGVSDSLLSSKISEAQNYSWHRTSRLFTEVDFATFSAIQENLWQLPGIGHQIESKRHYPTPMKASHVLGYLREADEDEYRSSPDIRLGDKIGKSGLEMIYEDTLRGKFGINYQRVNALGQSIEDYEDPSLGRPPQRGTDIITTIDADLQLLAEELMEGKKGGLVAIDPNSGAILAMVSSPQYDLSRLSGRLDLSYWQEINADSTTPLYNRAISNRQPPGSTVKPLMALIGLTKGLIDENTTVYNSGAYIRGRPYRDTAPTGSYDLQRAITFSSNTFFFSLMDQIATKGLLNEWSSMIKDFGLGVPNPIDLPYASTGIVPDSSYMNNAFGHNKWGVGDLLSMGIGQGLLSASPLQIAQMTSTIANGGYRVEPHVVQATRNPNYGLKTKTTSNTRIDWLESSHVDHVKEAMRGVIAEGSSAYYTNNPDVPTAGKTGTAQNPHGRDHGWFTSFAPYDDPQIVVTVLIENGGYGSISAGPVAAVLIEKYIEGEISRNFVYDYVLNFVSQPTDSEKLENQEAENE